MILKIFYIFQSWDLQEHYSQESQIRYIQYPMKYKLIFLSFMWIYKEKQLLQKLRYIFLHKVQIYSKTL